MTSSMRILPAGVALALALAAPPARGEVYEWTDPSGRQHFTEDLERVPEAHRSAALERVRTRPASRLQTYPNAPAPGALASRGDPLPRFLGSRPARGPGTPLRIPFTRRGTLMEVEVTLNDHVSAPFLVDTGASGISIPDRVARELGLRIDASTPRLPVQTAAGLVAEPLVQLDSIQVGPARVERVPALVNSSMEVGLLGGSFFNNFVYEVDAAAEVITLRPNDGVRGGLAEPEWRERFRGARAEAARLERYLGDNEFVRDSRRRELEERLETVRSALDALDREANEVGVPRSWRE